MNYKRKSIVLAVGLSVLCGLTACRAEGGDTLSGTQGANGTSSVQESNAPLNAQEDEGRAAQEEMQADAGPGSGETGPIVKHIRESYGSNFNVDADVHAPDITGAAILTAEMRAFDEQKVVSVLFDGKTPQKDADVGNGQVSYSDGDATLVFGPGTFHYRTGESAYYQYPTDRFRADYEISSAGARLGEVYPQENLSFLSKEEAIEKVTSVLKELSIEVDTDAEVYAVDSAAMQEQQDKRIREMSDYMKKLGITPANDKSENDPAYGYQIKESFSPDDDFYRLYFRVLENAVPVTQKSRIMQTDERDMGGSVVEVSLSKNGIMELCCSHIYQKQSAEETITPLLTAEEALQKAAESDAVKNFPGEMTVIAMDLEYVPVPYNDNYEEVKLVPAWSLTLRCEETMPSKDVENAMETVTNTKMLFLDGAAGQEIK